MNRADCPNRMQSMRHAFHRTRRGVRLASAVSALALVLLLTQTLTASEELVSEETAAGARILYPGDNLIGWVDFATTPQALFDQIPEANLIYTWDAEASVYRFAAPGLPSTFKSLEPGMGLIVRIGGDEPVEWQQPTVANGEWVSLNSGPNLVAWTGPSGTPIDLAVRSIGDSFTHAFYSTADSEDLQRYQPGAVSSRAPRHQLNRGDGLWIFNSEETRWLQPSGDRPLHPLGPPPDHVRWYASFDKYLDADGIAVIATDNVADEALFRAAAIFDEMLVNRPDIRDTLVRRRVHIAIVGQSERTFDLTPYRQYRNRIELEHFGPGGPRGIGPNNLTPTLIPEENLLCLEDDPYYGHDVAVHEFAHAIDYAISSSFQSGRFRSVLTSAYRDAREAGFWEGTHAMRNTAEFWATGVQAWLGVTGHYYEQVRNRVDLIHYAPSLADLIVETLGELTLHTTCQPRSDKTQGATKRVQVSGTLLDPAGDPLPQVSVLLRPLDSSKTTVVSSLNPLGQFSSFAEPGSYGLEFSIEGCKVYQGADGLTLDRNQSVPITLAYHDWHVTHQLPEGICQQVATGTLSNSDGVPLTKYVISATGTYGPSHAAIMSDGSFRLRIPDQGLHYIQINYKGCYYTYDGQAVVRRTASEPFLEVNQLIGAPLELKLPEHACEGRISGILLDQHGEPASGAIISLYQPGFQVGYYVKEDGSFSRLVDWPAEHILVIRRDGCRLYFGANEFSINLEDVEPLQMTKSRIDNLKMKIPPGICDA